MTQVNVGKYTSTSRMILNHGYPHDHPMTHLAMALSNGIQVHWGGEALDALDAVGLTAARCIAPAKWDLLLNDLCMDSDGFRPISGVMFFFKNHI